MYYLYLLELETSGKYYIGQTENLQQRLNDHNRKKKKYTKGKGP